MGAGKFVVISDLHAHPWAAFSTGDGLENDRLRRTLDVLYSSLARAQQLKCPWVFCGDLVHTAGYALNVVLAALADTFGRFPDVPKLVVWGNHDARGVGGRIVLSQTIWAALSKSVANLTVLDPSLSPSVALAGGLTFSGMGAQPRPDLLREPLQADVGVYHATVRGSEGPNGYVFPHGINPDELQSRHRFAVVGDLHHPQRIGHTILVPGSPEHHNFGDAGAHGWYVVTLPARGQAKVEFIPSESPEFRTVQTAADVRADGNFYRVLTSTNGEKLPKNATVVAPSPTAVESRAILRGLTGEQILAAWLHEAPPSEGIPEDQLLALGRQLLSVQDVGQLRDARLTKIALTNFCSYESAEFEIRDGTWLVLGKGRDYPSNGAGKSTLFEAIFWLLFGRTTKGLTGDEVVRWGADTQCMVWGEFIDAEGHKLLVVRKRGNGSTLEVEEDLAYWEATSVNEMTEKLNRRLGVTPELFQALGYFSQERVLLFASATDGERKEMLADLIGLSAYQEAAGAAQKCIDQLKLDTAADEGLQRGLESFLAADRTALEQAQQRSAAWDEERASRQRIADAALKTFDGSIPVVRKQLMNEALKQLTASNGEASRAEHQNHSAILAELKRERPPLVSAEHLLKLRNDADLEREATMKIQTRLESEEAQLAVLIKRSLRMEQELGRGICPSCGQSIDAQHRERCMKPVVGEIAVLEASTADLREQRERVVNAWADMRLAVDDAQRGYEAARELADLQIQERRSREILERLGKERADIEIAAAGHVDGVLEAKRTELHVELQRISAEINPHRFAEKSAAARVAEAEQKLAEREAERRKMMLQMALHEYWRHGFSKQGIQSLLMDEVATAFNAERGAIFPALTQGVYDVQLSTLSRTKAGEARERTEFKVYEHGEVVPYEALSGGQRRRIDVGVMLTLVKAISTWMQTPGALGLLVLDEVFGFLDASGAEGLMEALRDVQAVVPAIYAISHDPQLQALFSGTVLIEQDKGGISHIVGDEAVTEKDAMVEANRR